MIICAKRIIGILLFTIVIFSSLMAMNGEENKSIDKNDGLQLIKSYINITIPERKPEIVQDGVVSPYILEGGKPLTISNLDDLSDYYMYSVGLVENPHNQTNPGFGKSFTYVHRVMIDYLAECVGNKLKASLPVTILSLGFGLGLCDLVTMKNMGLS